GAAAQPAPVVLDRIAAVVNNEVITLSEVDREIGVLPEAPEERQRLRREVLERLIEGTLISQEAARLNVTVTEQEVDAEIAAVRQRERLTEEELVRALAQEGLTLADYRARVRDTIRRAKVISRTVRGAVTIPEARLREYYERHKADFTPPARVRLRLLLLPLAPDATDAEEAAVRAEAQALRLRALQGEPFEALVRAHSKGPAAEEGGDLGVLDAGHLDPRFEAAVRGLKPGEVSAPVELERGVALLQLVERSGGEPEPFERVREEIYRRLYDQEFERALEQWVEELKARAAIEVKL
ncbi:MAG TPA: peptidyl-prolyl cis-trans isomerase, partial [Thermodesulfobacteriota bacterium]|nr:peptidyl-prolyl cis-trans isomerase [Thermodesulfobacteriota bacterium]